MVSFVPPAPSVRARTRLPGLGPDPAWSSARRMISTWSALVLRPGNAGAQHERRALRLLRCQCRGRTMRSGGRSPSPFLKGSGPHPPFLRMDVEWTPTRVAPMSITGGRSAQTPAAGPPRRRRPVSARRPGPTPAISLSCGPGLDGLDGLDAVGQGPPPAVRPWGRRQQTRRSPSRTAARGPTGNGLPGPRAPPDPP